MKIHEYQAKHILERYGVPVPKGEVANTMEEAMDVARRLFIGGAKGVVVKAQIHAGGRGKGGGVKVAKTWAEAEEYTKKILFMRLVTHQTGPQGQKVQRLLIEETAPIARELYLGIVLDRATGEPRTGTTITFWPDPTVFDETEFRAQTITERMQIMAFLNKGLEIRFVDQRVDPVPEAELDQARLGRGPLARPGREECGPLRERRLDLRQQLPDTVRLPAPGLRLAAGRHYRCRGAQRREMRRDVTSAGRRLVGRLGKTATRGLEHAEHRRRHPRVRRDHIAQAWPRLHYVHHRSSSPLLARAGEPLSSPHPADVGISIRT